MNKRSNYMKRIISLMISVLLLLPVCVSALDTEPALDLQALGIIDTVPYENLALDRVMTRAEFSKVIIKMLGYDSEDATTADGRFTDVPATHWAAGYINLAASLGLLEGQGNSTFRPDESILLQEAVKTVVVVLGYKFLAQDKGYPQGYITQAIRLGILKGVSSGFEKPASRRDVFQLVYNALDVDQLTLSLNTGETDSYEAIEGNTIRNYLMGKREMFEGTGVVTATFETYLVNPNSGIEEDEVEIDGRIYKLGNSDAYNYLGVKVDFTAYEDESTGEYVLEYVLPSPDVKILDIRSDEIQNYSNYTVNYKLEKDKSAKNAKIATSAAILYNNRPITDWAQFNIENGSIRLIDNNSDGNYDVVLIREYISLPVESVNAEENLIKFKSPSLYNGVATLFFDMEEDDVRKVAYNAQGEKISLSDITEGMLISIFEDGNRQYMEIIAAENKVTGVLSEEFDEGYTVDGQQYNCEIKDFLSDDIINLGDEVTLYLNFEGKVGYIELAGEKSERYGYIIGTDTKGLSDTTVYIAAAGKVEKKVENLDNDPESNNTVTVLTASNSGVEELKLAKRYTITNQNGSSTRTTDKDLLPCGEVVKYRTNSSGELTKIIYPEKLDSASLQTYNARDNVFGKGANTPFGIDGETVILCVPQNVTSSLDDYLAEVKMENGQQYNVCGYDYNSVDCNVKLFVIEKEMNFEDSNSIGVGTSLAVVQKMSMALNEDGLYVPQLVLLTKELGVELSKSISMASYGNEAKISNLKKGDVIYYSQNSRRELVDVNVIMSLSNQTSFVLSGEGTDNEVVYGRACKVTPNQIDLLMNRRAYVVDIQTDEYNTSKIKTVYPHTRNAAPVFIYDKNEKDISFGSLDIARTMDIMGDSCDNVFVYMKNNTVQGIVLVRNS